MKPKVIVVTGANKGIGFEIARQLAKMGHEVILTARDANKGKLANEKLASQGWKARFIQTDVTKQADIQNLRDCIEEHFGHLDVLINNAAILEGTENSVVVSKETVQRHLETNFFGSLMLSQQLIPLLRKSEEGRIINFSSSMARLSSPGPGTAAYRFSKVAVNGLTAMMAADLANTNIKINSMDPGWVQTDMGGAGANRSVAEGADTAVWLATVNNIPTGKFFRDRKELEW
jgi:NAD(P)-dependent dehydrogenase (short-subunit alcohol dehydrogenase family)